MKKPMYEHDCSDCLFLKSDKGVDVYVCAQGGLNPTIIFRYGNYGPEYQTFPDELMELINRRIDFVSENAITIH